MCEIEGWFENIDFEKTNQILKVLKPRGPDAKGEWVSKDQKIWFGHTRLKILDLSNDSNQPMISKCNRYILCYNGEIYNYQKIKKSLQNHYKITLRGHSDTEILLNALIYWGANKALKNIKGMFSFAFLDINENSITLARDPLGIKPLYYYFNQQSFIFASDLDALRASGLIKEEYNINAMHYYFKYLCTPHPETIFKNVKKLAPGSKLVYKNRKVKIDKFYFTKPKKLNRDYTISNVVNELDKKLKEVIEEHMNTDVAYGAFLSGGIDSSLVSSIMQSISKKPINTFSIRFDGNKQDESIYSKKISEYLNTNHLQKTILPENVKKNIFRVISLHDEPFADNSSIPTYLLCEFARKYVTVALSGDGGDEFFGGYPRYFWASRINKLQRLFGYPISTIIGKNLDKLNKFSKYNKFFEKTSRFGRYLKTDRINIYRNIIACWNSKAPLLINCDKLMGNECIAFPDNSWSEEMMLIDQKHYLVDDILTKVDRMSMSVSLEARVPLLDTRITEFSKKIDNELKLGNNFGLGKFILRELLSKYLPKTLYERPKSGFGLPIERWLRNELKSWAENYFNLATLEEYEFLDKQKIMKTWEMFLKGNDLYREVWSVISLITWIKAKGIKL